MGSKSNFAAIFSVLPCFHARILPHFQVKPLPTLRSNAEISTVLYYSVITITSTTIINLLQPPLHRSVIESLFEINYLVLSGREAVTIFCTQSIWFFQTFFFCNRKQIYKHFKPHFHVNLTKPVFAQHIKDKARGAAPHVKTIHLRWLNTVLAVSEYMSFAKSWQEKGCSSDHKLKLGKWKIYFFWLTFLLFPWQHKRLNTTLKFHFGSVFIKFAH